MFTSRPPFLVFPSLRFFFPFLWRQMGSGDVGDRKWEEVGEERGGIDTIRHVLFYYSSNLLLGLLERFVGRKQKKKENPEGL